MKNITTILSLIYQLPHDDRSQLLDLIDITSEDDLNMFLGRLSDKGDAILTSNTEYSIHKIMRHYIPPILLLFGTFGNIFAFLVLRHKAMARLSTCLFLAALSVADSFVLVVGLLRMWIGDLSKFDIREKSDFLCKSTIALGYMCSNFSVWLIVAVTIERYIVVRYPLKAQRYCSVARAKRIIIFMCLFFVVINMHFFWTVGLHRVTVGAPLRCDGSPRYRHFIYIVWPWVDALIYSFLPFMTILVFNILIISRVFIANNCREQLQQSQSGTRRRQSCSSDGNTRITWMLLTVSFTFLLTTLPMNIGIICSFFWNKQSHDITEMTKFRLFVTIAELLMYSNHSINFFLYCATGQKFRNEIIKMVCMRFGHVPVTSDHSQHIYCSRGCSINNVIRNKSNLDTAV